MSLDPRKCWLSANFEKEKTVEQEAGVFAAILPLIILHVPTGIITILMAKRKGCAAFWWKLVGFIPFLGIPFALYLVGMTDKAVYDKLDQIEEALAAGTA